jgi:hypothetical protein
VETPTGPKLVWQQGTAGQGSPILPTGSGSDVLRQLALAPLPPRRPEDVVTTTGALAFAPMPPVRPGAIATASMLVGSSTEQRGAALVAPASLALASAQFANAPLPPPRPGPRPVAVASLGVMPVLPSSPPATNPAPATVSGRDSTKAVEAPDRPKASMREAPAQNPQPRLAVAGNAKVSMVVSKTKAGAAVPAGALANSGSTLAMGFSNKPVGDLATNRFTGPAVKPLVIR